MPPLSPAAVLIFPLCVPRAPSASPPAIRDLQNPPRRESLSADIPLPDKAASEEKVRTPADRILPVLPNRIRGDPPHARRASEKGPQLRAAVRRNKQARRCHLPALRRCAAVLRCLQAYATSRGKRPPVRTAPSPPLPPSAL